MIGIIQRISSGRFSKADFLNRLLVMDRAMKEASMMLD